MDLFQEINEAVYDERWAKRWHRYKLVFLSVLVAIVVLAGSWSAYRNYLASKQDNNALTFWHGLEQLAENQITIAQDDFLALATGSHSGYALLAQLNRATLAATAKDFAKARSYYADLDLAADQANLQQLVELLDIFAAVGQQNLTSYQLAKLETVAAEGGVFTSLAQEIIALHYLQNNELSKGLAVFEKLYYDKSLTAEQQARIQIYIKALEEAVPANYLANKDKNS